MAGMYHKGELVWYRDRFGTYVPAKVSAADHTDLAKFKCRRRDFAASA